MCTNIDYEVCYMILQDLFYLSFFLRTETPINFEIGKYPCRMTK